MRTLSFRHRKTRLMEPEVQSTAAVEACAGILSRAFASAKVMPKNNLRTKAVTPAVLALIGRALILRGEVVFKIKVSGGKFSLVPVAGFDIGGGADPSSWIYLLDIRSPSATQTERVAAHGVVHCMHSRSNAAPWRGIGPLTGAQISTKLVAAIDYSLKQECLLPPGNLLAAPIAGVDTDENIINAPGSDWKMQRTGANPPRSLIDLRQRAEASIFAACGVPSEILTKSDGTAAREAWRRFLYGTVQPLARQIEQELANKLDVPDLALNFDAMFASDILGCVRKFVSLVKRIIFTL